MDEIRNISNNIKYYRLMKGYTISELSKSTGISVVTLSKIENEKVDDIKCSTLIKIAHVLEASITELTKDDKDNMLFVEPNNIIS